MTTMEEHQKRAQKLIKRMQAIAFIIAGIMIVFVVYTSISKWKAIKEEQLTMPSTLKSELKQTEKQTTLKSKPGQVEKQTEQIEKQTEAEEIAPSVKIERATAKPFYCYKGIRGESTGCDCLVEMSGTATLPITKGESGVWDSGPFPLIFLRENPLTFTGYGGAKVIGESLTCPWYSNGYSECIRTSKQPATGKWSLTVKTGGFRDTPTITYFAVVYSYRDYKPMGTWDSVTLNCPSTITR